MQVSLTTAAIEKLNSSTEPIVLTGYKLGSDFSFTPDVSDIDIHGVEIWSGVPSLPKVQNANVLKYSVYLDYNLGDFSFGNVGLYTSDGMLFALAASSTVLEKIKVQRDSLGNNIRLDFYLTMVGQDYSMFLDYAETSSQFRIPTLNSVDQLPPSHAATPNTYVISGASSSQNTFLAYTDRSGLWAFDAYKFSNVYVARVTARDNSSVTFESDEQFTLPYFGEKIVQFSTGPLFGICRYVDNLISTAGTYVVSFRTRVLQLPNVGDTFYIYNREPLSTSNLVLPLATTTDVGVVSVGEGLSVTAEGKLSANLRTINGEGPDDQGNIDLGEVVGGLVTSVQGVGPDSQGNVTLPIANANQLGVVKQQRVPTGQVPYILITPEGEVVPSYTPVTSVNGETGDVEVSGALPTIPIEDGTNIGNLLTQAVYYSTNATSLEGLPTQAVRTDTGTLTVYELGNDLVYQMWQPDGAANYARFLPGGEWFSTTVDIGIASKSSLGIVIVGSGIKVSEDGEISIDVGAGLSLDEDARLQADVRTVMGMGPDEFGNIPLDLDHLAGYLMWEDVDVDGGIPSLSEIPDDSDSEEEDVTPEQNYEYARLRGKVLPKGTFYVLGSLANTGFSVLGAKGEDFDLVNEDPEVVSLELRPGGKLTVTISFSYDTEDGPVTETYTMQDIDAAGSLVLVNSNRTLTIDGLTDVREGHILVSVDGEWRILNAGSSTGTSTEVVINSGDTATLAMPAGLPDYRDITVAVKVQNPESPTDWHGAEGVATLTYRQNEVLLTNNNIAALTFRYTVIG